MEPIHLEMERIRKRHIILRSNLHFKSMAFHLSLELIVLVLRSQALDDLSQIHQDI